MRVIYAAIAIGMIGLTASAVIEHRGRAELSQRLAFSQKREAAMEAALQTEAKKSSRLQELLAEKFREMHELVARLDSTTQQLTSLKEDVRSRDSHISQLQTELLISRASPAPAGAPGVQLDPVSVSFALPQRQGSVIQVNPDWDFVVVSLGWDALKMGDIVKITREDKIIAQAQVERLQQKASAARILPDYPAETIQVNDRVTLARSTD